jgi:hypothetical protein
MRPLDHEAPRASIERQRQGKDCGDSIANLLEVLVKIVIQQV